jgi:hypothetical protein
MNKLNSSFDFLKELYAIFYELASAAERAFASDLDTTFIKLRQLAEAFAQDLAARVGLSFDENTKKVTCYSGSVVKNKIDPPSAIFFIPYGLEEYVILAENIDIEVQTFKQIAEAHE